MAEPAGDPRRHVRAFVIPASDHRVASCHPTERGFLTHEASAPRHDADLVRRAAAAFFRSSRVHRIPEAPDIAGSRVRELSGRRYVVLKRGGEVLRVYRVMTNGLLRAMNRPPRQLLAEA